MAALTEHPEAEPHGALMDDGEIVLLLDDDDHSLDLVRLTEEGAVRLAIPLL